MRRLLLNDGPNIWNYITEASIDHQFHLIAQRKALPILAENDTIFGFAVLILKEACPQKISKYSKLKNTAYINDVVVSASHSGNGIGSELLKESIRIAKAHGCTQVYIERHEENMASAGMMRKAGFELVKTFFDPIKRKAGSKNTSLMYFKI